MIEQLFGSKTRVKLLQLFYSNPGRAFYVREITRKVGEQINSVRRELANLMSIGIITSESNNNRLYYEVNQEYEHFNPLSQVFGPKPVKAAKKGAKAEADETADQPDVVIEHPLASSVRGLGRVELALLTGLFTRDEMPGIDVLIVGDVNKTKLTKFISDLEKEESRELRYTVIPTANYRYRLQINDRFISNVLAAKKQVIVNNKALPVEK